MCSSVEAPKPQLAPGESLIEINPFLIELPLRAELPTSGRKSSKPPSGSCGAAVPADLLQVLPPFPTPHLPRLWSRCFACRLLPHIQPHERLPPFLTDPSVPPLDTQAAKEQYGKKLTPAASGFCTALSRARQATISALHSTSASEAGVTEAVRASKPTAETLLPPDGPLPPSSPDICVVPHCVCVCVTVCVCVCVCDRVCVCVCVRPCVCV